MLGAIYRHFAKLKIFYVFLLSYIFVLMLPIAGIGIFGIVYNTNMLTQEAIDDNFSRIQQSREMLERQLATVDDLTFNLSYKRNIRAVFSSADDTERLLAKLDTMSDIALINATNRFTREISVFFERDRQVLLATSYNNWEVYAARFPRANIPIDEICHYMKTVSGRKLWPTAENGKSEFLVYTRSIPIDEPQQGLLLAVFDSKAIKELFYPGEHLQGYAMYLLDSDGNVLLSDSENDLLSLVEFSEKSGNTKITVNGTQYVVSFVTSNTYGLRFVTFVPNYVLMESVSAMRQNFIFTIGVCALFGVLLAFWLSRLNYRPVRRMMDSILKNGEGADAFSADYDNIISAVKSIADSKADLERRIEDQKPGARQTIAARMLAGTYGNDNRRYAQELEFAGIELPSDYFVVVLIHIDDCTGFSSRQGSDDLSLIQFGIVNIFEEILGDGGALLSSPSGTMVNLLISLAPPAKEGEPPESLVKLLATMQSFMLDHMQIEMSIGLGNVYNGAGSILQSLTDAQIALNQRFLRGSGSFSVYCNLSNTQEIISYHYPINRENQIINLIKSGNYDDVSLRLEALYYENINSRALPLRASRYFIYELAGTVLKATDDMGLPLGSLGEQTNSLINEGWLETETIEKAFSKLLDIIREICDYIVSLRESSNLQLIGQIVEYIRQNYTDANLSLFSIADHFSVSGSYLSRYFKEQTGVNFSDYICSVRIDKAKQLLRDKKLSVEKAAAMVGYNSANSFIRTFKRYESITPGQYQAQL